MTDASVPRSSLAEMLDVTRGDDGFTARLESFWGEAASEDLLARAIRAGAAERPGTLSSVHTSFLRTTAPGRPLTLRVSEIAPDLIGVRITDEEDLVALARLRFGGAGGSLTYQSAMAPAPLPAPDDLPSELALAETEGWAQYAAGPIETRRIHDQKPVADDEPAEWLGWLAPREPLPNDAALHAAAVGFASAYRSHWAVERRLGADFPKTEITLRDHSLFLHRAARWDDFWLVRTSTDVGVDGSCLSRREMWSRDGDLIASATWEATTKPR